jgi:hypothetical protein
MAVCQNFQTNPGLRGEKSAFIYPSYEPQRAEMRRFFQRIGLIWVGDNTFQYLSTFSLVELSAAWLFMLWTKGRIMEDVVHEE